MSHASAVSAAASTTTSRMGVFLRFVLAVVIIPGIVFAAVSLLPSLWHDLPAQVPTHWSGNGADAFGPPSALGASWLTGGMIIAGAAVFVALGAWYIAAWSRAARIATAIATGVGITTMLCAVVLIAPLRGLTSEQAALTTDPTGWAVVLLTAGTVAVSAAIYVLLPRHR